MQSKVSAYVFPQLQIFIVYRRNIPQTYSYLFIFLGVFIFMFCSFFVSISIYPLAFVIFIRFCCSSMSYLLPEEDLNNLFLIACLSCLCFLFSLLCFWYLSVLCYMFSNIISLLLWWDFPYRFLHSFLRFSCGFSSYFLRTFFYLYFFLLTMFIYFLLFIFRWQAIRSRFLITAYVPASPCVFISLTSFYHVFFWDVFCTN